MNYKEPSDFRYKKQLQKRAKTLREIEKKKEEIMLAKELALEPDEFSDLKEL